MSSLTLFLMAVAWPFFIVGGAALGVAAVDRKLRFRLRSLLIATTALAVALGLASWWLRA